jgi:hypothetical protein
MADKRLPQLPVLAIPATGSLTYAVEAGASYRLPIDNLATLLINSYSIFATPLSAGLMTSGNAEIILQGLNNAATAQLSADRVDLSDLFFDIDGGTMYDTYVNTSTYDGGNF